MLISQNRSFRLTCRNEEQGATLDLLEAEGFSFSPEPFCPFAFKLTGEPFPLGRSLAAFFGLIYIQNRSSMLPPLVLAPPLGAGVLDMCASPGSKTGLLSQLVGQSGFVLGNEPNPTRLATLRANLFSLNLFSSATCRFAGEKIPLTSGAFERILLDPPCSGWGTAEKNPKVMKLWTEDKIMPLVTLQRSLLQRAAHILPRGGEVVFSTCTTNVRENEEQVLWAKECLGLEQVFIEDVPGFTSMPLEREGCDGALRISPDMGEGQGFFVAKFCKKESPPAFDKEADDQPPRSKFGRANKNTSPLRPLEFLDYLEVESDALDFTRLPKGRLANIQGNVVFMPEAGLNALPSDFLWQGCAVGKISGGRIWPLPHLRQLVRPASEAPSLDFEEVKGIRAILSGSSLAVDLPNGFAGLFFRGLPLGLVKVRNQRAMWTER